MLCLGHTGISGPPGSLYNAIQVFNNIFSILKFFFKLKQLPGKIYNISCLLEGKDFLLKSLK